MFSASFLSKRSRIFITAAAVLAITPRAAHAQPGAAAPATAAVAGRTLTLDEALRTAYRNNRDLRQAKARVDQAHAGVLTAWSALLPTAAAQGKYTHNYKEVTLDLHAQLQGTLLLTQAVRPFVTDPTTQMQLDQSIVGLQGALAQPNPVIQKGEQLDFGLTAAIPLLVPFAYPALQAAHRTEDAGRANLAVSEAQVLLATAQAYYACAGADELVDKALDTARARLEAGVVNRVEVKRAELQLVRAQQALLESQDVSAASYRSLGTILNVHEPVHVMPADEAPAPVEPVETLTATALQLRPEFLALNKTIESNRLTVSSNALRWLPTLSAFGNVRAFNYPGFSGDQYSWAVGLQLDWTIYDGGIRDAQRQLAAAQRRENEARLDLLRDQVRDDVYNAERQLRTKRSALDTARRSVQLSKETLDLVQVQHDAGTATQLDLLQAQDNLVAAEVALAQARFDLALGGLSLERLSGSFPANLKL
jgi:outer membrane protein TolC